MQDTPKPKLENEFYVERDANSASYTVKLPRLSYRQLLMVVGAYQSSLKNTLQELANRVEPKEEKVRVLLGLKQKFIADIKAMTSENMDMKEEVDAMTAALTLVDGLFTGIESK